MREIAIKHSLRRDGLILLNRPGLLLPSRQRKSTDSEPLEPLMGIWWAKRNLYAAPSRTFMVPANAQLIVSIRLTENLYGEPDKQRANRRERSTWRILRLGPLGPPDGVKKRSVRFCATSSAGALAAPRG